VTFPGLEGVKGLLASSVVPQADVTGSFLPCLVATSNIRGMIFEGRWEADGIARTPVNINRSSLSFWFFSPKDQLNSLAFLIGTHQRKNRCRVALQIFRSGEGQPIRITELDARNMADNSWQTFLFEPIEDPKTLG
jgi:hypothetical protein